MEDGSEPYLAIVTRHKSGVDPAVRLHDHHAHETTRRAASIHHEQIFHKVALISTDAVDKLNECSITHADSLDGSDRADICQAPSGTPQLKPEACSHREAVPTSRDLTRRSQREVTLSRAPFTVSVKGRTLEHRGLSWGILRWHLSPKCCTRTFNSRTGCERVRSGNVPLVHRVAGNIPPNKNRLGQPGGVGS